MQPLDPEAVVRECLLAIDAGDVDIALSTYMADDCRYQFANAPAVFGRPAIADVISHIMRIVDRLEHDIRASWVVEEREGVTVVVCELVVSYWMRSGVRLSCPGCIVVYVSEESRIIDQRNYGDLGPVFAAAADEALT